jgi:DNA-directed RNA polymerase specialized sigma24 family protein
VPRTFAEFPVTARDAAARASAYRLDGAFAPHAEGAELDVLLDFLIGFSVAEIAECSGIPPSGVEIALREAFAHYAFVATTTASSK